MFVLVKYIIFVRVPVSGFNNLELMSIKITTTWLAQLEERQSAVWESRVRAPDQTNTQGHKITEEKVLPLQDICK